MGLGPWTVLFVDQAEERLMLSGTVGRVVGVVVLVGTIGLAAAPAEATFPGANGPIVFVRAYDIWSVNPDGSSPSDITSTPSGLEQYPAVSPDGRHIVFTFNDQNPGSLPHIWVMDADGTNRVQLTTGNDYQPEWSPDSTRIVFRRAGAGIWVMDADGTGQHAIVSSQDAELPSWSPDGSKIAYNDNTAGNHQIYTVAPDGSNRQQVTTGAGTNLWPNWSPDGTRIAFMSDRLCAPYCYQQIYVIDADGTNLTQLTTSTPADAQAPVWSPDGTRIAYMNTGPFGGNHHLFTMNPDGTDIVALTTEESSGYNNEYSPDWGAAAQGVHVDGAQVVDASGDPLLLRGVNYSGGEYMCVQDRGIFEPQDAPPTSTAAIASWNANAVRLPLNEDCWLGINGVQAAYGGAAYRQAIAAEVQDLTDHGLVPILELHWSAPGATKAMGQSPMPDRDHSIDFWTGVANAFKGNGQVVFDLFNEPYPDNNAVNSTAAWQCWRDGGTTCPGVPYDAVGMQELVDTVRATGARNLILLGGVNFANTVAQWLAYEPTDPSGNLAVSWHVYPNPCNSTACLGTSVVPLLATVPVVATEIGGTQAGPCSADFIDTTMLWLDDHGVGYLAWTWDAWGDCHSLINSWGTLAPTEPYGRTYHDHLLGLPQRATSVVAAAGDAIASVSWTPPVDHGASAITGYTVTASPGGASATVAGTTTTATVTGLANGIAHTFTVAATNAAGDGAASSASAPVTPQAGAPVPSTASGSVAAGETVTTDPGATPSAASPVSTAVTTPTGGTITIATTVPSDPAPAGYQFGDQQVTISAPPATPTSPLRIVFTIFPQPGQTPYTTTIYRAEAAGSPSLVPSCTDPTQAAPFDPCATIAWDASNTYIVATILASTASRWNQARPRPVPVTVSDSAYAPRQVIVPLGGSAVWSFTGAKAHTATEFAGLGPAKAPLFDSGRRSSGTYTSPPLRGAGTYAYKSIIKGDSLTGDVLVPMVIAKPASGTDTTVELVWATAKLAGYSFDVQLRFKAAGSAKWGEWLNWRSATDVPEAAFTPTGSGTYAVRARLRNVASKRMSGFSPDATLTVP